MKSRTVICLGINALILVLLSGCRHKSDSLDESNTIGTEFLGDTLITGTFPNFVTPTNSFYVYSNNPIPEIKEKEYQLKVYGAVNQEKSFSLTELRARKMINRTVTVECIGNSVNGNLIGNVLWTGFSIFDLIDELGLKKEAVAVKYICKDGYFMTNTIDELKNSNVIGALYMNLEALPIQYGFPVKIIFPGYHGVRQPGWITEIEVLVKESGDYWSGSRWKARGPIGIDCKLFYPRETIQIPLGKTVQIAGAAYGSRYISKVEVTTDGGTNWDDAIITKKSNEDFVWVFWKYNFKPTTKGNYLVQVRATDTDGAVQIKDDTDTKDGTNSWPSVLVKVK